MYNDRLQDGDGVLYVLVDKQGGLSASPTDYPPLGRLITIIDKNTAGPVHRILVLPLLFGIEAFSLNSIHSHSTRGNSWKVMQILKILRM